MPIEPIDLTALISSILGISIVLIPVLGITARFALQPVVQALSRLFESRQLADTVQVLERRIDLMEQQLDGMDASVRRVTEVQEFHRALEGGPGGESAASQDG